MKLLKVAGATSEIWQIFIQDSSSTTGAGLTGLAFNTGSLTAYYHRDTDTSATAISLVTMTVGTFTSSGFKEIDATNMPGWYQFCPPNASIASGAKSCGFLLKGAASMAPLAIEVQLSAVNPDSASAFITGINSLAPPTNWNLISIDGNGRLDIIKIAGTTQTARDIGASVLLSSGTGAGQLDFTSGIVKANATQILGTAVSTPATAGILDVNLKNISNAAVSTSTAQLGVNVVNIKGSASAGAAGYVGPDWANIAAPTSTVGLSGTTIATSQVVASVTGAVGSVTGNVGGNVTGSVGSVVGDLGGDVIGNVDGTVDSIVDISNILSDSTAFAGASIAAIKAKTDLIPPRIKKNAALAKFPFVMTDSTTHAPKTGVTVTAQRSINGASFASCANAPAEIASGGYYIDLAASDLNGDTILLRFTGTACDDKLITIVTQA